MIIPLSMTYRKQGDAIARLKARFKSSETHIGVFLEEVPLIISRKVNPALGRLYTSRVDVCSGLPARRRRRGQRKR